MTRQHHRELFFNQRMFQDVVSWSADFHSSTHPFIHPSIHLSLHSFIHSFIHSRMHSATHSSTTHSPIHLFIHSFTHSSIHTVIHPSIHWFAHSLNKCVLSFFPEPSTRVQRGAGRGLVVGKVTTVRPFHGSSEKEAHDSFGSSCKEFHGGVKI